MDVHGSLCFDPWNQCPPDSVSTGRDRLLKSLHKEEAPTTSPFVYHKHTFTAKDSTASPTFHLHPHHIS
ncbi:Uncharacterized protein HZ326_11045 [Fusarium oxysporum f. sp. albedinis]|nr:Uncharacterized protein HZ326_11045 [Fusarium oxysporum f. sp. albedinis]